MRDASRSTFVLRGLKGALVRSEARCSHNAHCAERARSYGQHSSRSSLRVGGDGGCWQEEQEEKNCFRARNTTTSVILRRSGAVNKTRTSEIDHEADAPGW